MEIKVINIETSRTVATYTADMHPEVFDNGMYFKVYANGNFSKAYSPTIYRYEITEKEND